MMFDRNGYQRKYRETHDRTDESVKRARGGKLELVKAYGGKCVCCGESRIEFLTIDHVEGGGRKQRKEKKLHGTQFYHWLRARGFPKEGYRLLCYNCNCSRGHLGYCPHDREKLQVIQSVA